MITNIKIKNIKGYGDPATSIDIELKTNRVNIIHAPNGTGKSSLAMAFGSLQKKSLAVAKDNKYHKDETLPSELCITMDGSTFMANDVSNTISPVLDCTVINCATLVSTTQHNRGQYTNVYGYLDIKDIEIASKIPVNVIPNYQISTIRTQYNVNGKILPNLNYIFSRRDFYKCCENIFYKIELFSKAKKRTAILDDIKAKIQSLNGTSTNIIAQIQDSWFDSLEADPIYTEVMTKMISFITGYSRFERYAFRVFNLMYPTYG